MEQNRIIEQEDKGGANSLFPLELGLLSFLALGHWSAWFSLSCTFLPHPFLYTILGEAILPTSRESAPGHS